MDEDELIHYKVKPSELKFLRNLAQRIRNVEVEYQADELAMARQAIHRMQIMGCEMLHAIDLIVGIDAGNS